MMSKYTKWETSPLEEVLKKYLMHNFRECFIIVYAYMDQCGQFRFILFNTVCESIGERGRYRLSPVTDGPAERAGVQNRDRLIWINGAMISTLSYAALSKMVSALDLYSI